MPERATLELTVRALSPATLERLERAVERVVEAECLASGCQRPPEIRVLSRSPVNVNDAAATAVTRAAHEQLVVRARVLAARGMQPGGIARASVVFLPGVHEALSRRR